MARLFVHAINVHHGGGAVLLHDLLRAIPSGIDVVAHVDVRMKMPSDLPEQVRVELVEPTLLGRLAAERRLVRMVSMDDRILCFGNLPPLFKLHGKVIVFLQNRYLIDLDAPLGMLPLKSRIRLWLESNWLRRRRFNASQYIVQTPSMQRLTENRLGVPVVCAPFMPVRNKDQVCIWVDQQFDFLYVASGEPHKNHVGLIRAWGLLADSGLFPTLALTLEPESAPKLCELVAREVSLRGLRIHNLGMLPSSRLLDLYRKSGALIYPSSFESFGLPLVEACQSGLPILAPELDYVRDVVVPDETFDPRSPVSIARAVKRFLKCEKPPVVPASAKEFIAHILAKDFQ
jgi:glycosyltransferase involved in cell wall biosynthesis